MEKGFADEKPDQPLRNPAVAARRGLTNFRDQQQMAFHTRPRASGDL
jgi:hypothetical protein